MGADTIKRIAHKLGWTRETKRELSDLISETAVVESTFQTTSAYTPSYGPAYGGMHMSQPIICTDYWVKFGSETNPIEVCDEFLYRTLHAGDKVNISYRKITEMIFDYVGDDFSQKQEIEHTIAGCKLERAEKIKE
jgi:hypothetical protein